jgi:transcriptional regulator with XRE-family HTH domain
MRAGPLIRDTRLGVGLTQAELAARLGTTQSAIAKLESRSANPTVATLDRVLRATGHRLELLAASWSPGVDETLIRRHLELTPGQRIESSEALYASAREIAVAGQRARGELA